MALLLSEDWRLRVPPGPGAAKPCVSVRSEPPLGRGAEAVPRLGPDAEVDGWPRASLRVEATSAQRGRQSQRDLAAVHLRCGAAIRALAEEAIMRLGQQLGHELQYGGDSKPASCLADLLVEMRESICGEPSKPSPGYEHHGDGVGKSSLARVARPARPMGGHSSHAGYIPAEHNPLECAQVSGGAAALREVPSGLPRTTTPASTAPLPPRPAGVVGR